MEPRIVRFCRWISSYYSVPGMDADDLYQEAILAAWLAPGHERLAAKRRIFTLLRRALEHRPQYVELVDEPASGDLPELVEARELLRLVISTPLSELERNAVGRMIRGEPTGSPKTVENAAMRARRKLRAAA